MSPKKTILRALTSTHEQSGGAAFTRPSTIDGFSREPERFQKAVNELLQARLIEGRRDSEGHMAIALNSHRMGDVHKLLRPGWTHPAVWSGVALMVAVAAVLML